MTGSHRALPGGPGGAPGGCPSAPMAMDGSDDDPRGWYIGLISLTVPSTVTPIAVVSAVTPSMLPVPSRAPQSQTIGLLTAALSGNWNAQVSAATTNIAFPPPAQR